MFTNLSVNIIHRHFYYFSCAKNRIIYWYGLAFMLLSVTSRQRILFISSISTITKRENSPIISVCWSPYPRICVLRTRCILRRLHGSCLLLVILGTCHVVATLSSLHTTDKKYLTCYIFNRNFWCLYVKLF